MVGKSQPQMFAVRSRTRRSSRRGWTLERIAKHAIDFWLSTEDLPQAGESGHGRPARDASTLSYTADQRGAEGRISTRKLKSLLGKLDMNEGHLIKRFAYMKNEIPVAGVAHQAGTCRWATTRTARCVDRDCRAHEVDNLYVVDTSVFPSIGAVNPALTAMANSLRVGDHLLERLGSRAAVRAQRACRREYG